MRFWFGIILFSVLTTIPNAQTSSREEVKEPAQDGLRRRSGSSNRDKNDFYYEPDSPRNKVYNDGKRYQVNKDDEDDDSEPIKESNREEEDPPYFSDEAAERSQLKKSGRGENRVDVDDYWRRDKATEESDAVTTDRVWYEEDPEKKEQAPVYLPDDIALANEEDNPSTITSRHKSTTRETTMSTSRSNTIQSEVGSNTTLTSAAGNILSAGVPGARGSATTGSPPLPGCSLTFIAVTAALIYMIV